MGLESHSRNSKKAPFSLSKFSFRFIVQADFKGSLVNEEKDILKWDFKLIMDLFLLQVFPSQLEKTLLSGC